MLGTLSWAAIGLALGGVPTDRPNVVLILADDIGWNDFGCYGNSAARTPAIDRLAERGIRFTRAYLTASSCSPSRASIITGRYPHNLGSAAELHQPIASHLPWFPALLRQAGYYTALVGKNHMTSAPLQGGEARWDAFELVDPGHSRLNHGGHARWVATLARRPRDRPFFCWFAAYDAHRDWEADREWDAAKYGPQHRPEDVVVPPFLVDNAATRRDLASYYNEVTRFDYYVGEVVAELARQQVLESTLILVMADNGRPFPRAKTRLHDSGMKTALVAHWPRRLGTNGRRCEQLVSAIDLAPTVLQLAGVDVPSTVQGISLVPLFADPSVPVRRYSFSEHNWHDYEAHGRAVREGDWLLIRNFRPALAWQGPADSVRSPAHQSLLGQPRPHLTLAQADVLLAPRPELELYNTATDPWQLHNVALDPGHRSLRLRLSSVLERWMDVTGDSVPHDLTGDRFDRATGERLDVEVPQGTTPGEDRNAAFVNARLEDEQL